MILGATIRNVGTRVLCFGFAIELVRQRLNKADPEANREADERVGSKRDVSTKFKDVKYQLILLIIEDIPRFLQDLKIYRYFI